MTFVEALDNLGPGVPESAKAALNLAHDVALLAAVENTIDEAVWSLAEFTRVRVIRDEVFYCDIRVAKIDTTAPVSFVEAFKEILK